MITERSLQGHWQRDWIRAPGFEDASTRVHWLQAGDLFADIRVPLERPGFTDCRALSDLPQSALAKLMDAEGFAGATSVSESQCTWHREINWHGVPEAADIGAMSFDPAGNLIEDGVLAEYRELWHEVHGPALRGQRLSYPGGQGIIIENHLIFLIALGAQPSGTSKSLRQSLTEGVANTAAIAAHFASTYCLGRWKDGQGIATLSTNPFCENRTVLSRGRRLMWHGPAFDGVEKDLALDG